LPEARQGDLPAVQAVKAFLSTSEASTFPIWRTAQAVAEEPAVVADSRIFFKEYSAADAERKLRMMVQSPAATWNTR
jgi:hypothetical protein